MNKKLLNIIKYIQKYTFFSQLIKNSQYNRFASNHGFVRFLSLAILFVAQVSPPTQAQEPFHNHAPWRYAVPRRSICRPLAVQTADCSVAIVGANCRWTFKESIDVILII